MDFSFTPTGARGAREIRPDPGRRIAPLHERPFRIEGRFFVRDGVQEVVKGVTYGTFRPDPEGNLYPAYDVVATDLRGMARHGFNALRTYTVPPPWFLDLAARYGVSVLVGVPWEQHVAFLAKRADARRIRRRIREGVAACRDHPAVLGYAVGNEIPAPMVRWFGSRKTERFLRDLIDCARDGDPEGLVTYVNFPSTEYLELPTVDFHAFNVYLESEETLASYLARIHNLSGDLPLVMGEIGLDSLRNGEEKQAETLSWQIRTSLESGCAGAFVFAWTDEWYRGGAEIDDWAFGLTTRERRPKPALSGVSNVFAETPFGNHRQWPRMSAVVCTYNGSRTLRRTLEGLRDLPYPDYEVIVVNDGSTDDTAAIVDEFPVRAIHTPNRGLSAARNVGAAAATGEIVAYIDDDAYPDPHWLHYLALTYQRSDVAAVGGPNILPAGSGPVASAVYEAPGRATHVLLSDSIAEHLPGCNLSVRKEWLDAVGGFDPRFRAAGDDVDLCWKIQERGGRLGFHPGAVVWHACRDSMQRYWRQQKGYGRAEAKLERKWPDRYNAVGHVSWAGRLYGGLYARMGWQASRIYYGVWGTAPFQALYRQTPGRALSAVMMPEWHLVTLVLALVTSMGVLWPPLWQAAPFLLASLTIPVVQAIRAGWVAGARSRLGVFGRVRHACLTATLHLVQPLARLTGRIGEGLTPWRDLPLRHWVWPRRRSVSIWSESWRAAPTWLGQVRAKLGAAGIAAVTGGPFDRWDLAARTGLLGGARTLMTIEEHGQGRQYIRFRVWPWVPLSGGVIVVMVLTVLGALAARDRAITAAVGLDLMALLLLVSMVRRCGAAQSMLQAAIAELIEGEDGPVQGQSA